MARTKGIAAINFTSSSAFGSATVAHGLAEAPEVVLATVKDGISASLIGGLNASAYDDDHFTLALWLADLTGALAPPSSPGEVTVAWVAVSGDAESGGGGGGDGGGDFSLGNAWPADAIPADAVSAG